jgi:uncharacterized pyridoxal phosphate-containing UPF0001 family protein
LAATKGRKVDEINNYANDFRRCVPGSFQDTVIIGESYTQELLGKKSLLKGVDEIHFIGRIQSNKIEQIVRECVVLHSVGRGKLLTVIENEVVRQGLSQGISIFLQVNISDDAAKDGFRPDEVPDVIRYVQSSRHLKLMGLMTITRLYEKIEKSYDDYTKLVQLGIQNGVNGFSMGMSSDYLYAIKAALDNGAGRIMLRLGAVLF